MRQVFLIVVFFSIILTVKGRGFFHHYQCSVYQNKEQKTFSINLDEKMNLSFQDGRIAVEMRKKNDVVELSLKRSLHIIDKSYEKKILKKFEEKRKVFSLSFEHFFGANKETIFLFCKKSGMT